MIGNIIQQLIDTGYIPEEKIEELLSDFGKGINELLQFKKVEKKNKIQALGGLKNPINTQ